MPSTSSDIARAVPAHGGTVLATSAPLRISVIVPVRNEASCIAETLRQIINQRYPVQQFEIIVADGRSIDETRDVVQKCINSGAPIRLIDNPKMWSSAGRNAAIRVARGDLIVIIDGHCALEDSEYLIRLDEAFERTGADCLGRPQPLRVVHPNRIQRAISVARQCWLGHHPASHIYSTKEMKVPAHSVAIAYRRTVFEAVGLFDESYDACEDVELNHRVDEAGLCCMLIPSLRVFYHPRSSLKALFRQMVRYGRGRMRLLRKHPNTFSVIGFGPAMLVLGLCLGPLGLVVSPSIGLAFGIGLLLYVLILVCTSCVVCLREGTYSLIGVLLAVFVTLHIGAGTGIIIEAFAPRAPLSTEVGT